MKSVAPGGAHNNEGARDALVVFKRVSGDRTARFTSHRELQHEARSPFALDTYLSLELFNQKRHKAKPET